LEKQILSVFRKVLFFPSGKCVENPNVIMCLFLLISRRSLHFRISTTTRVCWNCDRFAIIRRAFPTRSIRLQLHLSFSIVGIIIRQNFRSFHRLFLQ
jgi:hypothetical protein